MAVDRSVWWRKFLGELEVAGFDERGVDQELQDVWPSARAWSKRWAEPATADHFSRNVGQAVAFRPPSTSEASLGPPRWVAGLGGIVAVGCWLGSGPRLPRMIAASPRGWALVRTGLVDQVGGHGCGGDGERCA